MPQQDDGMDVTSIKSAHGREPDGKGEFSIEYAGGYPIHGRAPSIWISLTDGRMYYTTNIEGDPIKIVVDDGTPSIVVQDFFNRPAGTDMGNAPTGQTWVQDNGIWVLDGNMHVYLNNPDGGHNFATVETGLNDGIRVAFSMSTASYGGGMTIGYVDEDNFLAVLVNYPTKQYELIEMIGGVRTTLLTSVITAADGHFVSVVIDGQTLTCSINGVEPELVATTSLTLGTKHGLFNTDLPGAIYNAFAVITT